MKMKLSTNTKLTILTAATIPLLKYMRLLKCIY